MVDQQVSAMVIIAMGMASPNTVDRGGQPPGQRVPGPEDQGDRQVDEQAEPGQQGQVTARRARLERGHRRYLARPPGRDDGGDGDGEHGADGDQRHP